MSSFGDRDLKQKGKINQEYVNNIILFSFPVLLVWFSFVSLIIGSKGTIQFIVQSTAKAAQNYASSASPSEEWSTVQEGLAVACYAAT